MTEFKLNWFMFNLVKLLRVVYTYCLFSSSIFKYNIQLLLEYIGIRR